MPTYAEYEALRALIRERVQLDRRTPGLLLSPISPTACQIAQKWPMPPRVVSWDWRRIIKRKDGGDLDLAVWHGDTLCGLAYGRAKRGWLQLDFLEGNPNGHPLKGQVMTIALAVLRTQAAVLELPQSRLANPFIELRDAYRARGWPHLVEEAGTIYLCSQEPG